jgi:hypothetical protein
MMNTPSLNSTHALHREVRFGTWTVSLERSPKRTMAPADFLVGARWAGLGVLAALATIALAAMTGA